MTARARRKWLWGCQLYEAAAFHELCGLFVWHRGWDGSGVGGRRASGRDWMQIKESPRRMAPTSEWMDFASNQISRMLIEERYGGIWRWPWSWPTNE